MSTSSTRMLCYTYVWLCVCVCVCLLVENPKSPHCSHALVSPSWIEFSPARALRGNKYKPIAKIYDIDKSEWVSACMYRARWYYLWHNHLSLSCLALVYADGWRAVKAGLSFYVLSKWQILGSNRVRSMRRLFLNIFKATIFMSELSVGLNVQLRRIAIFEMGFSTCYVVALFVALCSMAAMKWICFLFILPYCKARRLGVFWFTGCTHRGPRRAIR